MSNLYSNIEAERARNGMTIQELADKIGMSEKNYRNWKKFNKPMPSDMLIKIARLFECSADYLLGLTDKVKIQ